MLSSPSDIIGAFDQLKGFVGSLLPEYGVAVGGIAVFVVLVRMGVKILTGASAGGGSQGVSAPASESPETSDETSGTDQEKQNDSQNAEALKEEELRREQEQLRELFEIFEDKEVSRPKTHEEKELEELGLNREDLERLKDQYRELTIEISALMEKGLTGDQMAKSLISRSADQISLMELQPLIEAMMLFLRKNEQMEKNIAVIGVDSQFEQKAALSALKRGEYETALSFLERQAVDAVHKASSSHRSDVCQPALEQAASLYRAIGVLTRPIDPEKSFEALMKSKELDAENIETKALIARAYYESGKTKKAEQMLENIAGNTHVEEYISQYADQMVSQIRMQHTMQHAQRIREEYEHMLGDAEGRQKTDQRIDLRRKKREEVRRANSRFIVDELLERDNEHQLV